ncbi:MAG: DUF1624 domain-containing protein [Ignavibacteriae bacterium]|nr:MAG: DUF1624 domain-containing protein [Ignavibacteriota bacterium]
MSDIVIIVRGVLSYPFRRLGVLAPRRTEAAVRVADGRLYALDLARFLAMLFMMQGHVLDALVTPTVINTAEFPWNIWHFVRGFTAPIFLMVSGAVHAFATKRGEDGSIREDVIAKRIRWALTIMGIGYLMFFPASRIWDLPFVPSEGWKGFFAVNILQLTGAAILLFVFAMASTRSVKQMGQRAQWMTLAIVALTPVFQYAPFVSELPLWLRSYVSTDSGSLFPIFPFAAYLFAGLAVGARLHAIPKEDRDARLKYFGWRAGAALMALALTAQLILSSMGVGAEHLEHPASILLFFRRVGFVLMFFSLSVVILERTWVLRKWYSLFGTKSLWIYIIHLVILFGTPWWSSIGRTEFRTLDLTVGVLAAIGVITTTLFMAWGFEWYARQPWALRVRTAITYVGTAFLAAMLLF